MNYLGPESYQGVRLYENGEVVRNDTFAGLRSTPTGNGRIVVGRFSTDQDEPYASLQIDELVFFNNSLTDDQIQDIFNAA